MILGTFLHHGRHFASLIPSEEFGAKYPMCKNKVLALDSLGGSTLDIKDKKEIIATTFIASSFKFIFSRF